MEVYRVGGAVRDRLLGRPVHETDWVVVGATPQQLEALGYRQVGRDFPVFLHPQTGEEYALARRERKTGSGYHGFEFDTATDVTLEEDLSRRDLTINAMAMAPDGRVIDPWNGRRDLAERRLRHVSEAFVEDPVRILRVARFAARFAPLGFAVAEETQALMRRMVDNGEVDALVPERVWSETQRALAEERPQVYFSVLRECGALARTFPEIDALFGVPQPPQPHPEIDTGVHTLMVLEQAARLSADTAVRFAALVHDLGKGTTPPEQWPRHIGHEGRGVKLIRRLCERLKVPREHRELAELVARQHGNVHRAAELRPATVLKIVLAADGLRRPQRLEAMLLACEADARGRTGLEERPYPQARLFRCAAEAAAGVSAADLMARGLEGPALGQALHEARERAVADALRRLRPAGGTDAAGAASD